MTTYRCSVCGKDVEVEEITEVGVVEVAPCKVCIGVAEEAIKEDSYDQGYQEGWQEGYDTADEEAEIERRAEDS